MIPPQDRHGCMIEEGARLKDLKQIDSIVDVFASKCDDLGWDGVNRGAHGLRQMHKQGSNIQILRIDRIKNVRLSQFFIIHEIYSMYGTL